MYDKIKTAVLIALCGAIAYGMTVHAGVWGLLFTSVFVYACFTD